LLEGVRGKKKDQRAASARGLFEGVWNLNYINGLNTFEIK
jgi:hypothetical protein